MNHVADTDTSGAQPFGQRLRERRRALGLSQTEVAGGALSASYMSLLEAGKRTPTDGIVTLLAQRLKCTPQYLLQGEDQKTTAELQLAVTYAELALRNGEAKDALSHLSEVFARVESTAASGLTRSARRLKAQALEAIGRLEESISELEVLSVQTDAPQFWEEHLRVTIDLVRCYQEIGDVDHSLEVGRSALAHVETLALAGSDVHAELASAIVGAYYVRGDLTKAAELAAKAVTDVEKRGSARGRAATYWNASLVAEARGDIAQALILAQKALALYAESDDARALARLRVTYGWLMLRTTPAQPKEARRVLLAARKELEDVGSAVDLAYCDTELARCWLLLGRPKTALADANKAGQRLRDGIVDQRNRAGRQPPLRLESAYVDLGRGAALLALGRRQEAISSYRAAATLLDDLDLSHLAAGAWRELGDAFVNLGLHKEAGMAYQQALTDAGVPAAPALLPEHSTRTPTGETTPRRRSRRASM